MAVYLHNRVTGMEIVSAIVHRGDYLSETQAEALVGRRIESVRRRGKYLLFRLDMGILICHNAMSGYWDLEHDPWTFDYVEGKRVATERDVRVSIVVRDREKIWRIRFHDSRLFGSLKYYKRVDTATQLSGLGPEPVVTLRGIHNDAQSIWNILDWKASCTEDKRPVKEILMDQREVVGIGNIYATEALWRAGVNPWRPGNELVTEELVRVMDEAKVVLMKSIESGIDYKSILNVYRQKTCPKCFSSIEKEKLAGRSTYFCRKCQKVEI